MVEVWWHGETLTLLAERAIWWERTRTICVADLHLGKPAAFRSGGVPVPEGVTGADLERLTRLVRRFEPRRLAILGDLLHARSGRTRVTMEAFGGWRRAHAGVDVLLVRGNHDVSAGDPPPEWEMRVVEGPHGDEGDGAIRLAHDPAEAAEAGGESGGVLCGHIHPSVTMLGAVKAARARCFWLRESVGVLPAFGSFTGSAAIRPTRADRVFAVDPDGEGVHEVGAGARQRA